jgi:hypothetical protein
LKMSRVFSAGTPVSDSANFSMAGCTNFRYRVGSSSCQYRRWQGSEDESKGAQAENVVFCQSLQIRAVFP